MNEIAVYYLARLTEGFPAFERFAQSYRAHSSGIDHDLIVIAKGFEKPGQLAALDVIFTGIPHSIVSVEDDCGFDIHAYREASRGVKNPTLCFLNTFSTVSSENWLKKLFSNFDQPNVGIVGATGSYESISTSWRLCHKVYWLGATKKFLNRQTTGRLLWLCQMFNPRAIKSYISRRAWLKQISAAAVNRHRRASDGNDQYEASWKEVSAAGMQYCDIATFPTFPNPHIRTNVFMVSREHFLKCEIEGPSKIDCCKFESGPNSITALIRREGLTALMVGADGVGYDIADWPLSGCFRSQGQRNLLARDNQTDNFDRMSLPEQQAIMDMSWGGYRHGPGVTDTEILGIKFSSRTPIHTMTWDLKRNPSKARLFSVVIPCRNRAALLVDAIKTITQQGYENIEICVFDNACDPPIADSLQYGDNRIKVERSDVPLHVVDSWNNAMNMATGDYVTFIGDDDGLLPGFFERISAINDNFNDPDVIFYSLYQFMHPGVSPEHREGYVSTLPIADFMVGETDPFVISRDEARRSVDNSLRFKRSFHFNMPAFTAKREFLDSIRVNGLIFRPPFPDYYFANAVLDKAKCAVAEPRPLALQGISKLSFGFTMLNGRIGDGFKSLGEIPSDPITQSLKDKVIPASKYQTEYLFTMGHLADTIDDPTRRPDVARYRRIQVMQVLSQLGIRSALQLIPYLSNNERFWLLRMVAVKFATRLKPLSKVYRGLERTYSCYSFHPSQITIDFGSYTSNSDVYQAISDGRLSRHA